LADSFERAHGRAAERAAAPVFLVFHTTGVGRDVRFLGLAVPGAAAFTADEDLVAVWRTVGGQRFQNYRATFTILAVPVVSRAWVNDVLGGAAIGPSTPDPYRRWVEGGDYVPLVAPRIGRTRSRAEQLPSSRQDEAVLAAVHRACADDPVSFERVAVELWRMMASAQVEMDLTRPTLDGGRDAIGRYFLGPFNDPISLEFSLEAKCYSATHGVGVREVSRLVSRIRHREFGIFVTTSYIAEQAYREIRDDAHPIVFLVARDIADLLRSRGIATADSATSWVAAILNRPVGAYADRR
jgi:hypothetical protein